MDFLEICCNNIKPLRKVRGLTQEDLAFPANISINQLRKVEHGAANTTIDTISRITQTLHIQPFALGLIAMSDNELQIELNKRSAILEQIHIPASCKHIGESIKLLRKHQKLTQKQIAAKRAISEAWLREAEHGCANITLKKLEKIAAALGISLFTLSILHIPENKILEMHNEAKAMIEIAV